MVSPYSKNRTYPYPNTIFWADDIAIFSESEKGLQEKLEALEKYIYSEGYGPTNEKLAAYLSGFEELAG